jgi:hypothetical protein
VRGPLFARDTMIHGTTGSRERTVNDRSLENLKPFEPGQSGNPNGRAKTRHLTNLLGAELAKASGKSGQTREQRMVERLVTIALTGKRTEALRAMQLIFAYRDGLPVQTFELDVKDVARRLAEARGLDPENVVRLLDEVRRQRVS